MAERHLILDACALIALQRNEEGAAGVWAAISAPEVRTGMHALNVCEVYYDALRRDSATTLAELLVDVAALGIGIETRLEPALIDLAGHLKARWRRISLADCVALALATLRGGSLLTSDHHEFDALAAAGHPVRFLR